MALRAWWGRTRWVATQHPQSWGTECHVLLDLITGTFKYIHGSCLCSRYTVCLMDLHGLKSLDELGTLVRMRHLIKRVDEGAARCPDGCMISWNGKSESPFQRTRLESIHHPLRSSSSSSPSYYINIKHIAKIHTKHHMKQQWWSSS